MPYDSHEQFWWDENSVPYTTRNNKMIQTPTMTTKCGSCNCIFGTHWTTYDQTKSGCTTDYGQRDGCCTCKGFAIIYKPVVQFTQSEPRSTTPTLGYGGPGEPYGS